MALITVAAPVTTSPPAQTPVLRGAAGLCVGHDGAVLACAAGPAASLKTIGFGLVPRAKITVSTGISNSEPSMGIGERRPGRIRLAQLHADAAHRAHVALLVAQDLRPGW